MRSQVKAAAAQNGAASIELETQGCGLFLALERWIEVIDYTGPCAHKTGTSALKAGMAHAPNEVIDYNKLQRQSTGLLQQTRKDMMNAPAHEGPAGIPPSLGKAPQP